MDCELTDDVRHDVYLTLLRGLFNKGAKRADKNVQVATEVLDTDDQTIPVCTHTHTHTHTHTYI